MIEVKNLKKFYGEVEALAGVSFSVRDGEVIGLLGPNGAGKTTLMKILTGFLHPSAGEATVGGLDVLADTVAVQGLIGYLPENAPLYPELTVQAHLQMIADLRQIPKAEQRAAISEAIFAVGLADRLTQLVGSLSKGYRQRVGLAQAILHKPKLLILDEPTNGLDPTQIIEVRHLIKKLAKNSTILLSTHILSEVEATCDRAIIIINGQLRADAQLSELSASSEALLTLGEGVAAEEVVLALSALAGVRKVQAGGAAGGRLNFRVEFNPAADLCPAIFQLAKVKDWPLWELRKEGRTLEAVFKELVADLGGVQ